MDQTHQKKLIQDWYKKHSNDVYKFIFYFIYDKEQAKDIMQDTFIKAYNNLETFNGENPKSWLYKIARNLAIDYMRRNKLKAYLTPTISKSLSSTPEESFSLNEQEKELYRALEKLKRPYREVIILRKIKELSIMETAQILGWSESKVKTNLSRGLNHLKNQLEKEGFRYE
ncbi:MULTISPECIES: RNA polymerase sigma factor [Bacillaceae]|uniref:RNA polymerase sigma factor n=1 Tax=Evansella alkalicola TaxID=745819 RepID=A0ABS6JTR1_9BACI|nr:MULTISPECIES: RNA polymerase sigma factor [Bacillaceae]MBU9721941.1 RNA polymerase sigma factor [Bacillus alkalicola]